MANTKKKKKIPFEKGARRKKELKNQTEGSENREQNEVVKRENSI